MIAIEPQKNRLKAFSDDDLVCHCFKYTKRDIENDYREKGHSSIYERIAAEKKAGGCNCAALNPKGT